MATEIKTVSNDQAFEDWMKEVDASIAGIAGLSSDDLPDRCYRDMFDDETTPADAAREVLEEEGLEF